MIPRPLDQYTTHMSRMRLMATQEEDDEDQHRYLNSCCRVRKKGSFFCYTADHFIRINVCGTVYDILKSTFIIIITLISGQHQKYIPDEKFSSDKTADISTLFRKFCPPKNFFRQILSADIFSDQKNTSNDLSYSNNFLPPFPFQFFSPHKLTKTSSLITILHHQDRNIFEFILGIEQNDNTSSSFSMRHSQNKTICVPVLQSIIYLMLTDIFTETRIS